MKVLKFVVPVLGLAACAAFAHADSIVIQLGAGTTGTLNGQDVVVDAGSITVPNLTLNVAQTVNFYTPTYDSICMTCSGTVDGTLKVSSLVVTDETVTGAGSGSFSQGYSDSGNGSGTNTFTPLASPSIDIALSNGDTLVITPLAGTADPVTAVEDVNGPVVQATLLLEKTPAAVTPEPPSVLLLLTGIGAASLFWFRRRLSY